MNLGSKEPKKDDYAPTPNRSSFQSDKCASFQLRTHLTEVGFRKCWMIMATLGWKYDIKQGLYYTPFGLNMGKSTECMRRLDYYALGGVTFRFDMVHECVANETNTDMDRKYEENQEKKLKQTRHELLAAIFTRFYAGARCSDSHSDGIKVNVGKIRAIKGKNHTSEKKLDCGEKSSTNNVREMQYSLPLPSATANEKGAEQFFDNKKLQKPKSKIKLYINPVKKGTTKTVNDKPQPITSLGKRKADKDSFQPSETSVKKKMIGQMEQWPSPKTCVKSLQDNMHGHNKSIESKPSLVVLEESLSKQFTEWKFLQSTQHSFLLYGFGSKKSLLDKFTEEELRTAGDVLTFNGYDCEINIHTILDFMVQIFLYGVEPPPSMGTELSNVRERILFEVQGNSSFHQESNSSSSKVLGRAVAISKQLAKQHPRPIYLVVHSIDGINLQNQVAQEALANLVWNSQTLVDEEQSDLMEKHSLSSVGNNDNQKHVTRAIPSRVIRLIASVDHVDASSSLWDSSTLNKFSWVSCSCARIVINRDI